MLRTTAIASIVLLISTAAMAQAPANFIGVYQGEPPVSVFPNILPIFLTPAPQLPADFIGVYQSQQFVGGITNSVQLDHGDYGQNIVSLIINNNQDAENMQHMNANQGQDAFLMQVGEAFSDGGVVDITQELGTVGSQSHIQ